MEKITSGELTDSSTFAVGEVMKVTTLKDTSKVFYSTSAFNNRDVTLAQPSLVDPLYQDAGSPILTLNSDGTFRVEGKARATFADGKMSLFYLLLTKDGKEVGRIPIVDGHGARWEINAGNNTWEPFDVGDGGYTYNSCIFEHVTAVEPHYKGS